MFVMVSLALLCFGLGLRETVHPYRFSRMLVQLLIIKYRSMLRGPVQARSRVTTRLTSNSSFLAVGQPVAHSLCCCTRSAASASRHRSFDHQSSQLQYLQRARCSCCCCCCRSSLHCSVVDRIVVGAPGTADSSCNRLACPQGGCRSNLCRRRVGDRPCDGGAARYS